VRVYKTDNENALVIANTIRKDEASNDQEALEMIYKQLRSGEAPDLDTAKGLIERLFFNPKRYDLGVVGRYRLNKKLGLETEPEITTLTRDDIVAIVRYLIDLLQGQQPVDDIDHLGNRRVRTVGEQLAAQYNVGVSRMARTIKERMNIRDVENFHSGGSGQRPHHLQRGQRLLRHQPAVAVHGPDQPAFGTDAQAPHVGARTGRPDARTRRLRGARRALHALRTALSD
jgi:DNA-directed RNA polymerase beta subunit